MTKRVVDKGIGSLRIIDTSKTLESVDSIYVAESLGAELLEAVKDSSGSPFTIKAVKQELLLRLRSSGGRPGLMGATRRQKIPLSEDEWQKLQKLSDELARANVNTTPGQIAGIIIHCALKNLEETGVAS